MLKLSKFRQTSSRRRKNDNSIRDSIGICSGIYRWYDCKVVHGQKEDNSMIENLAWVLPRPRRSNKYIGSFPQHFEKKVIRLLGFNEIEDKEKILHPFGGMSEYGIRVDIKPEVNPDFTGDAHDLNFKDESFDLVILDPPYSDAYSKRLYGTKKPKFKQYTKEAVRVLKNGGYLVMYHYLATPRIENTILIKRIFLETRVWHKLRCIHIHKKAVELWT